MAPCVPLSAGACSDADDRAGGRCAGAGQEQQAKKKGPGNIRSPFFVSGLRFAAAVAGAAAAQKSPKPTHVRSPVRTAHEEQLTERIP